MQFVKLFNAYCKNYFLTNNINIKKKALDIYEDS